MIILATPSIPRIVITVMIVTLILILIVIAYRKIIARLGKGGPVKENYAVLFGLESKVITGEIEFYFTLEQPRNVSFWILDQKMQDLELVVQKDYSSGGHIVRYDSSKLENGIYFYGLKSDNQKTMKRMVVDHTAEKIA